MSQPLCDGPPPHSPGIDTEEEVVSVQPNAMDKVSPTSPSPLQSALERDENVIPDSQAIPILPGFSSSPAPSPIESQPLQDSTSDKGENIDEEENGNHYEKANDLDAEDSEEDEDDKENGDHALSNAEDVIAVQEKIEMANYHIVATSPLSALNAVTSTGEGIILPSRQCPEEDSSRSSQVVKARSSLAIDTCSPEESEVTVTASNTVQAVGEEAEDGPSASRYMADERPAPFESEKLPLGSEAFQRAAHKAQNKSTDTPSNELVGEENPSPMPTEYTTEPAIDTRETSVNTAPGLNAEKPREEVNNEDSIETFTAANASTPSKASMSSTSVSTATPAISTNPSRTAAKGKTYVGGMLASNKAMKPFRSPLIARKDGIPGTSSIGVGPSNSLATPSKRQSGNSGRSMLGRSLSSHSRDEHMTNTTPLPTNRTSRTSTSSLPSMKAPTTPANAALNKPFKSLFSKTTQSDPSNSNTDTSSASEMIDVDGKPMSSIQLSANLLKLERRLALLKDAKRHRIACEKGLDSADNTDYIKELSLKWLEKGREAAEMLWDLVKDNIDNHQDQKDDSGTRFEFDQHQKQKSNWGWDEAEPSTRRRQPGNGFFQNSTGTIERMRERVSEAIEALTPEEQAAFHEQMQEEEEDPLPDADEIIARAKKQAKRSIKEHATKAEGANKKARLEQRNSLGVEVVENDDTDDNDDDAFETEDVNQPEKDEDEDNDALSDTVHDEEQTVDSHSDVVEDSDGMAVDDDPNQRGMAKMFSQCGIESVSFHSARHLAYHETDSECLNSSATFGWDAAREEWNTIS